MTKASGPWCPRGRREQTLVFSAGPFLVPRLCRDHRNCRGTSKAGVAMDCALGGQMNSGLPGEEVRGCWGVLTPASEQDFLSPAP